MVREIIRQNDVGEDAWRALQIAAELGDELAFLRALAGIDWLAQSSSDFVRAVRLALAAGAHMAARRLAQAGNRLYPSHPELAKMARILAAPRVLPAPPRPARRWQDYNILSGGGPPSPPPSGEWGSARKERRMHTLGRRLRALREAAQQSQTDTARLAGVSQSTISDLENGNIAPKTVDAIIALARHHGVSTDYLLGLTDDPKPKGMDLQERIAELEEQLSIALTALANHVDTVIEQDAKIAELEARLAQASRWARLWKQAAKRRRIEDGDELAAAYLVGRHDERKQREREAQP